MLLRKNKWVISLCTAAQLCIAWWCKQERVTLTDLYRESSSGSQEIKANFVYSRLSDIGNASQNKTSED